jgi:hypothetical protein
MKLFAIHPKFEFELLGTLILFIILLLNFVTHSSVLSKKGPSDDHQSSLEIAVSHLYWQ